MRKIMHTIWILLAVCQLSVALAPQDLTFLILSQNTPYLSNFANNLKISILEQSRKLSKKAPPNIIISYEEYNKVGAWALTPIINDLAEIDNAKWLIICEDQSDVNLPLLVNSLEKFDYNWETFLGHTLHDHDATIIHHFSFFENTKWFKYAFFRAGCALTMPLLKRLKIRLSTEKLSTDFFIDSSYELSLFIWNKGEGTQLTSAPFFCLHPPDSKLHKTDSRIESTDNHCAIYPHLWQPCKPSESRGTLDKIMFAVKTCKKYHNDRLPVIQRTWSQFTKHVRYYSDVEDKSYQTISSQVENTESGHCEKTLSIINLILNELSLNDTLSEEIQWIALADDDTMLSVKGLSEFLTCYDASSDIYLGERYGYRLLSTDGFNYITGGGGIVISLPVARKIVKNCVCPAINSPDDMVVAFCLHRVGVEPVHSSRFHQARPNDYPMDSFVDYPISFHKHWQIDPFRVYEQWFEEQDSRFFLRQQPINCDSDRASRVAVDDEIKNKRLKLAHTDL